MTGPAALSSELVDLNRLQPHPDNANLGNDQVVADSLNRYGQWRPLVAQRSTGRVLIGHTMLRAARSLGWQQIAVHYRDVNDDEARRILAMDNRSRDLADTDDRALAALLESLDGDLSGTGYVDDDVRLLHETINAEEADIERRHQQASGDADTPAAAPPAQPVTQPGEVWQLGPHRLLCGDARNPDHVTRLFDGKLANLAITSPPYAKQRDYDPTSGFEPIAPDEYVDWFEPVQALIGEHLTADGSWLLNINAHAENGQRVLYVHDLVLAHVRSWAWRLIDEFVWVDTRNGIPGGWRNRLKDAWEPVFHYAKNPDIKFHPLANGEDSELLFDEHGRIKTHNGSGLLGGRTPDALFSGVARPSNVLHIATAGDATHAAAYPVALPAWFVRLLTDPGDLVYDPFLGSGTTLIAAQNLGRTCLGMELSPTYCDVTLQRWAKHTGETPQLLTEHTP